MNKKNLAYFLTYQFVPKTLSKTLKFTSVYNSKRLFGPNERIITQNLNRLLETIVQNTLTQCSGDIGLLLSGGVDSAILLHLLRNNTNKKIHTLSAAYDSDRSHLTLCAWLAKKFNTQHHELIIYPKDLLKLKEIYSYPTKFPIGDNGLLSTFLMMKSLSEHTKNIFSGDGADCVFFGLPCHVRDYQHSKPSKTDLQDFEHYRYDEIFLTNSEASKYLKIHSDLTVPLKRLTKKIRSSDPIKRTILIDLNFLVANRIDYIIHSAKANSVSVKLPYLDKRLINFALQVPSQLFIKNNHQKYILRKAFQNDLPSKIVFQKKKGMTPPFIEWYRHNRLFVLKTLCKAGSLGISPEYIQYLIKHISHSHEYILGMRIWLLLNLVLRHESQRTITGREL